MTNIERQKKLDKEKWLESEKNGYDMGGCMLHCQYCEYADHTHPTMNGKCYATQKQRQYQCLCATAYNRWDKKTRKPYAGI